VDSLEAQDGVAGPRRRRDAQARTRRPLRRELHTLEPLQHLDAALHLARLRGLEAETLDEALGLGDATLLVALRRHELLAALLLLPEEAVVVTLVEAEVPRLELRHAPHVATQEAAVVGDHHHRPAELGERLLEPLDRGEIQVVGGLVEQQHVGRREQQLRQLHAHQPAAAEGGQRPPRRLAREAEPRQHALHARLPLEPPSELEGGAAPVVALGKLRGHLPASAPNARHLGLDLADLVLEVVQVGEHRRHLPPHRPLASRIDLLAQQSQPHRARRQRSPGVRHLEPRGNPQQRRLAGPVGPHQPDAIPPVHREIHVAKQHARSDRPRNALEPQQHGGDPSPPFSPPLYTRPLRGSRMLGDHREEPRSVPSQLGGANAVGEQQLVLTARAQAGDLAQAAVAGHHVRRHAFGTGNPEAIVA